MRPDKYSRTAFTPTDQSYGDVRLLDPQDETRVLRIIPAATLRGRVLERSKAPPVERRKSYIPDAPRAKRSTKPGQRDWLP